MNRIRLFEEFINEFEYGDKLFADPRYRHNPNYGLLLKFAYDDEDEPDTEKEKELFRIIKGYLQDWKKEAIYKSPKEIKTLLKLKDKFPQVLDPAEGLPGVPKARGVEDSDLIYRGMSIEIPRLQKLLAKSKAIEPNLRVMSPWFLELENVRENITSRSKTGFVSCTTQTHTAKMFTGISGQKSIGNNRWPVVVGKENKNVKANSILSKHFTRSLSGMEEGEFWVIGNQLKNCKIWMVNPYYDNWFEKWMEPPYRKRYDSIIEEMKGLVAQTNPKLKNPLP